MANTWDRYTDAMYEQTYFNWLVRRAGLPVFDIGSRYNHMVISGWPTADARIVHFAGIGFRAVAVAPPDVWTAKHSDMQDLLNAAEGVATWTFDAERIEPDRGQVERSENFFSRLASAEPHDGVLGRSVATALPRGRYELRIVGLAAEASARLGVAVVSPPERHRIAFASREARNWDPPLVFEIAEPFKTVSVELAAQGSPLSIEQVVLTQIARGAWGIAPQVTVPAESSLSALRRSEAAAALSVACELRRQLAEMHQASVAETGERERDRERFAAAHEQIQARLDALAEEATRGALARTELEGRLAAANEKAEATAATLAATREGLATVTAERDRFALARTELEGRLATAIEKAEATAATLAAARESLAEITAERDRLAQQCRRWFEAAVPPQGQADPTDRHTGSPLSSIRRRSLLRDARNAAIRHRWELAARYYSEILNVHPRRPAIWVQFGNNLKDAGKLPEAERAYRRALDYQENSADTHLQLGYVLALQDRGSEAAASLVRSLTLAPGSEQARAALRALGWTEAEIAVAIAETAAPREGQPQQFQAMPRLPSVSNRWSGIFRR